MSNRICLVIFAIAIMLAESAHSQLWEPLGGGTNGSVTALYADSTHGMLYVGGSFLTAGDSLVFQIASWDGTNWGSLGNGTGDTNCFYGCNAITSINERDGLIFASGGNVIMGGIWGQKLLSAWNGSAWDTCGIPDGGVSLDTANGLLFACGSFTQISNQLIPRIAVWNGQYWVPFGDPLLFPISHAVSCCTFYQGSYYVAGNFVLPNNLKEVAKWDLSSWQPVGMGIFGDAWVNELEVFKNQMFAGGRFLAADGNAADFLMAFDGIGWYNPFPQVQYESQVKDLRIINNTLYMTGQHRVFDGSNWHGPYQLAKYDGLNFCSFGGQLPWTDQIAGIFGEIYINIPQIVGNDTLNYIAKWIGGDSTDICISQPVRVEDPTSSPAPTLSLYPNPTNSSFTLTLPPNTSTCTLKIHDITGHEVAPAGTYRAGDPPVDVTHLSAGLYFVEVRVKDRVEVVKLVKE